MYRRQEGCTGFWWENLKERSLIRPGHRSENNINMDLQEVGWGEWTELMWQRIGRGGGLM